MPLDYGIGRFFHRILIAVLRHLLVQFVHQLSLLDSVDFTEWYMDETKMEANANRYTFVWHKRVEKGIAKLKEKRRQIQEQMLAFTSQSEMLLHRMKQNETTHTEIVKRQREDLKACQMKLEKLLEE
ncbi:hypothetical protein ACG98G_04095 [Megasphaera hexanoica]|uniref:hypothetical protein n=1 Tax=Megasphaera hexanoica TaxID=1675036 RepID=UPI000DF0ADAC|nr:hypothetical protein [Megasphaera hexanoica]AXB82480.1 hypothetical protein ACT01_09665 [Megasphaera hexanoica]